MKTVTGARRPDRAGFSLVEAVVATAAFSIVGYVLVAAVDMGARSKGLVESSIKENRAVLSASSTLVEELMISSDERIDVQPLADGNSQVTLQVPVEVEGVLAWGTEGEEIAAQPELSGVPNENWSYRYTVQKKGKNKRLVRQVLDDKLTVQSEVVLVARLDMASEPSFLVQRQGDMWVVNVAPKVGVAQLSQKGRIAQQRRSEIHVRSRN